MIRFESSFTECIDSFSSCHSDPLRVVSIPVLALFGPAQSPCRASATNESGTLHEPSTRTVSFKYDPFGRRVYKSSSSATSVYAYDGINLIEETNSSGSAVARYSQTQNIDEPLAMLRSSATSYYHADGLGSVTSLSNAAGSIANTYTYDSFGKLTASTGSLTNSFRYTGREFDTETSLYYNRARYYDPNAGRFISEDPLKSAVRLNRYKYVNNSPNILSDPSGLQEQCTFNGTQQIGPWIYSVTTTPDSGWHFLFSFAEGGEFPFPWISVTCNWERKITKEVWKSGLFLLSWNCEETGPCGVTRKRIKYSLRRQREFVSITHDIRDPTATSFIGGPQDDEANDLDCVLNHRPLE